jgi:glycosyltransferase involved in cell wall biosynthesis
MNKSQSSCSPILSLALPIRNGERLLSCLLDSLLAQDFDDFEIVISDNASDDNTQAICQEYAQRDSRIRYFRNPENIGLLANFNRLIGLCRGKYMRWIGWDDWLEPDYARRCVAVLESRPDAIGVTTSQDFFDEDGIRDFCEYKGERLDSPFAHVRYRRMLWFMTNDFRFIDPIYTMMRREVLEKIGGHRLDVMSADQVLAVELSLRGSFAHIPICLSHRGKLSFGTPVEQLLHQCYLGQADRVKKQNYLDIVAAFWAPVNKLPLSSWERFFCFFPITRYFLICTRYFVEEQLRARLRFLKRLKFINPLIVHENSLLQ